MSKHVMRIHPRGLHRHGVQGFGGPFDINFIANAPPNVASTTSTKSATFMVSAPRETMSAASTSSTKSTTFLISAPAPSASTSKTTEHKSFEFDSSTLPGGSNWTPDTTLKRARNRAEEARESASTPDVQVDESVPERTLEPTSESTSESTPKETSDSSWLSRALQPGKRGSGQTILGLPWWQTALIGIGAFSVGIFAIRALR